jgi:hypothetical protein
MLAGALLVGGALDALVDVAQNAHGLRVQRRYGRSILNSFHALWSIGAVLGGLLGSAAAGLDLDPGVHLGVSAVLFSGLALGSYRFMLPGPDSTERDPVDAGAPRLPRFHLPAGTVVLLLALGLIACCATATEDAGASWGALYLSNDLGAAAATAGLAFVSLQGLQFVGRLLGDRMVDRFGQRAVAQFGGATVALGMGVALAFPSTLLTIVGFGAAGFGVATLVPAAMHTADELPGLSPGTGLSVISWLMRMGFLVSPPVIGVLADASSLRVGLLLVPVAGVTTIALSRYLAQRASRTELEPISGVP